MLLSAGLAVPSVIAVHGYLTVDGQKIGKSLGNAIDPEKVVQACGVDAVRYFLCRHIRSGRDGDFSVQAVTQARNSELADGLGNLLNRTTNMILRYFEGRTPARGEDDGPFAEQVVRVRAQVERAFEDFRHDEALGAVWSLVESANKYVVEQAPWTVAKQRSDASAEARLAATLYNLVEVLRIIGYLLFPFMPGTSAEIFRQLGIPDAGGETWDVATRWGRLEPGARVQVGATLFPKADPRSA
jgi:methionyl-tRNA synthetase